ncbi:hypothetical protein [Photobacterium leiognathi]|uniref:hypothetical protein n=1 Tax=Photobacterium leiognathi TaxID=553611 RepID=UPI00273911FD|nr:hypothetical protein [Photobacterium leiognathi]
MEMTMIPFDTHKAVKELIESGIDEKQAETLIGVINDIYANEAVTKADLNVMHSDLKQEIHAVARDMEWIKKLLLAVGVAVLIAALKYIFS